MLNKVSLNSFIESSAHWKHNWIKIPSCTWPTEPSTKITANRQRVFYEWHSWFRCVAFVSLAWHSFCSMGKLIFNKRSSIVPLIIWVEGFPGWRVPTSPAAWVSSQPLTPIFPWRVKFKWCIDASIPRFFVPPKTRVCTGNTHSCLHKRSDEPTITVSVLPRVPSCSREHLFLSHPASPSRAVAEGAGGGGGG